MSKINKKGVFTLISIALILFIFMTTEGLLETVVAPFDYYFTIMLRYSIACFEEGLVSYGILCLLLQIAAWLIFVFIMKVTVFNFMFPRIRIVDALKNTITYARKVKMTTGKDNRFIYMKIKFKFFPVLRWHTLKLPKPKQMRVGIPFLTRRLKEVENGVEGIEWRRMPSTLDVVTEDINLCWNAEENTYELSNLNLDRTPDPADSYRDKTVDVIKRLSQNVNESVRGDAGLLKDQYQTGIPITTDILSSSDGEVKGGLEPVTKEKLVKKELRNILEMPDDSEDLKELHEQIDMLE